MKDKALAISVREVWREVGTHAVPPGDEEHLRLEKEEAEEEKEDDRVLPKGEDLHPRGRNLLSLPSSSFRLGVHSVCPEANQICLSPNS